MLWKPCAGLGLMLLLGALSASPQVQKAAAMPLPGDEMIYKYLCAEADKLSGNFLDGAKSLEEWQKKRPRLYQEYMDMLGLWPLPEKTPLKATITGHARAPGRVVDKLHFQSQAGPLRDRQPLSAQGPVGQKAPGHPLRLRPCQPGPRRQQVRLSGSRHVVRQQRLHLPDARHACSSARSRRAPRHLRHLAHQETGRSPLVVARAGYTPAGVECWNGIRAIDYLLSRADVDPERHRRHRHLRRRGGHLLDRRRRRARQVAVPVSGMSDLESYVKNKVINGHCDCMFLYNTYQWDWTTIAALVAPRPLLFANSDNDPIFPMDGNRRIIAKLRQIYKMYGKPDLVDEYVSKGGHAYRPDLRIATFRCLNKHLKNDTASPVKDVDFKTIPGKELRSVSDGRGHSEGRAECQD